MSGQTQIKIGMAVGLLALCVSFGARAAAPPRYYPIDKILLPSKGDDKPSPEAARGKPYLPLVAACAAADPKKVTTRRATFTMWEYVDAEGIPAVSLAENFIAAANKVRASHPPPYSLVLVIAETKGAPRGRYTNGALVYATTFQYCVFDMPEKKLQAKDTFEAYPPAVVEGLSNSYSEHRRSFAAFVAKLPLAAPAP